MEQLLEPFAHVAELLAGGVLAKQHDEWAAALSKGKSGGTEFVQPLLRELIIAQRTDACNWLFASLFQGVWSTSCFRTRYLPASAG